MPEQIDTTVFKHFKPWEGIMPAGFFSNYMGTKTRETCWASPEEHRKYFNTERFEKWKMLVDDNVFDWIVMLEAIVDARDEFLMAALGAGWGRWLVNAAAAVEQFSGIPCKLVGVEAEPTHFRWMQEHLADNGLDVTRHDLIEAAVAAESSRAWFYVGRPNSWYGQSLLPTDVLERSVASEDVRDKIRHGLVNEVQYNGETVKWVRSIGIAELLSPYRRIDYIHMDVQGAELAFLEKGPDLLSEKVGRILIGTHSPEIEQGLRSLFEGLRWQRRFDYPMGTEVESDGVAFTLGDGVQAWTNPGFSVAKRGD